MSNNHSDWIVVEDCEFHILIKDLNLGNRSVTNDAENVVKMLWHSLNVTGENEYTKRLFYIDSENNLDEIIIENGKFAGFRPGTNYYGKV